MTFLPGARSQLIWSPYGLFPVRTFFEYFRLPRVLTAFSEASFTFLHRRRAPLVILGEPKRGGGGGLLKRVVLNVYPSFFLCFLPSFFHAQPELTAGDSFISCPLAP